MQHGDSQWLAVGPHAVFGLDASGLCTHSTGPALAYMGLRAGELVGTNLFELYRDDEINVAALKRVLTGETFSLEREFHGRLLSTFFEPVLDADGSVTGGLGVTTDITEQRRIEAQLRAAEERASVLAEISAALSRELDPDELLRIAVRFVTGVAADVGLVRVPEEEQPGMAARAAWRSGGGGGQGAGAWLPLGGDWPSGPDVSTVEAMDGPRPFGLGDADAAGLSALVAEEGEGVVALRVPLRSGGRLLGLIDLARGEERGPFTPEETAVVAEMAERCALALDHALLMRDHQRAREDLVKFQALADASEDLIAISDPGDRTVYVNPRVRTSGFDLTGSIWDTASGALVEASLAEAIRTSLGTSGRWAGDVTVRTPDESLTVNASVFRLEHPETGLPLGTAWIGQDVTELRATEAALRESNADLMRFKALVDASPDFIAIADMQGTVQYLNPGGRAMVGLAPDLDAGGSVIVDYAAPEGMARLRAQVMPAVLGDGHWEGETALRDHRGGRSIPVANATFLVRDAATHEPFAIATVQRDITERLAAEAALRDLAEQRQALLTRLVDAEEAERTRIAADVHDDPVQACAAMDLRLGQLRRHVGERAPELLGGLDALQLTVAGATDRLRALLFDLEPPDLARGLTGALDRAAREIFEDTDIGWSIDGEEPDVPNATRVIGYRIAKEALTNVRKHARARHVTMTVFGDDGGLRISVEDDGVGLGRRRVDPSPGHRGLSSMQDRAAVAGGRCMLRDREGGGTVVTVWLPGSAGAADR